MSVYRFRISFEDNEDIYRDIEIKSSQTFEDFHFIILQSIKFDTLHTASFFISDDYWRKGDEITLKPVDEDDNKKRRREEIAEKKQMTKCKMASLIDDPHQKFVYVYDPKVAWTFLVELIKILPDDATIKYPRIAKSVDDAPSQYNKLNLAPSNDEDDLFDDDDFEDEIDDDEAAYADVHSADEISELKGEEGETETEDDVLEQEDDMEASDFEEHADEQSEED